MTTEQYHNDFLNQLISIYERREAANITDWVFENITGLKRLERSLKRNVELEIDLIKELEKCLHELLKYRPVQYVLNEAWFYKMKFYVNENVLIPRPETEELVEWVVLDVRSTMYDVRGEEFGILDVGTGSGCIAVSIKNELENIEVTAIDVSEEALKVAKKNADTLQPKINFLQVDFLNESLWNRLGVYDIIVSNPPYIHQKEKEKLSKNVTAFEPHLALFVDDNDPFIFYKKMAKFAQSNLKPKGKVFVEIHEDYSEEVDKIFLAANFKTEIRKDMYGKNRMLKATRSIS
ncbi:peptide chain release factor N(5)-glutamine methyltransferase [Ginsengibacter hankyongi]|uniref:peptide chain release factor N(5)-glutamine methyltransferase n=1 Tax=Ginsengibacter hankyongi TaxID=2607284 RepID=A0A5J5IN34_9BACT|nr:peptide chain release factor N(5)-glutamine methyltransferase [Ginsengibacter hankyongi]KAA9041324.1 peptide chain release factor N(5)-glutamine methyltransferase [Ginsengibacter hankyongi]